MPEYIEREALIEKILSISVTVMGVRSGKTLFYEALKSYREAVLKNIKKAPTADVAEVRHGAWIHRKTYYEADECDCSLCGQPLTTAKGIRKEYCPTCGARMDGRVIK